MTFVQMTFVKITFAPITFVLVIFVPMTITLLTFVLKASVFVAFVLMTSNKQKCSNNIWFLVPVVKVSFRPNVTASSALPLSSFSLTNPRN